PEDVTVEDVEDLMVEGWRLGLKALAIYRDNCKVAQPLSADKKKTDKAPDPAVIATGQPQRRRLPKSRPARTTSFRVADTEGYLLAGEYPDDGLGELFLKVSKPGSTLSGVMDALAMPASVVLKTVAEDAEAIRLVDAPLCYNCGNKMRPAGSCYVCESCGSTSGCS